MDGTGHLPADTHACPISLAALADGAAQHPLLDSQGGLIDPVVTVDLTSSATAATLARATTSAQTSDRILIGIADGALGQSQRVVSEALDLTLLPAAAVTSAACAAAEDPVQESERLHTAASENPHAAMVLAHVLRTTARLDVPEALDVESLAYSTLLGGPEFAHWLTRYGVRQTPPDAANDPIVLERSGNLLRITLNRPERRNAYGRELRDALVEALRLAELDEHIHRVVLTGAGPSFCSGGDLDEFGTTPDLLTAHWVRTRAGAGRFLHRLSASVEAHLHGTCVGAGIELPAFCAHVSAAPETTFRLPEVSMGLIPGAGGTVSIPRRIGRWRTLWLALSGAPLEAETAHRWELIDALEERPNPATVANQHTTPAS